MNIEKETLVILVLLAIVLAPMWFFALTSASSEAAVVLSQDTGAIDPTGTFLPTPVEANEFVAGVITWVALFALVGMIYYTHQFIRTVGQSGNSVITSSDSVATDGARADGGHAEGSGIEGGGVGGERADGQADSGAVGSIPPYILAGGRRLVDYWPAQYAAPGVVGIAVMSWSAVAFSVLFIMEALSWARTQFLGIYGGMVFLSLGVLGAVYTTWFLPSMHVVEERGHEGKMTTKTDGDDRS